MRRILDKDDAQRAEGRSDAHLQERPGNYAECTEWGVRRDLMVHQPRTESGVAGYALLPHDCVLQLGASGIDTQRKNNARLSASSA